MASGYRKDWLLVAAWSSNPPNRRDGRIWTGARDGLLHYQVVTDVMEKLSSKRRRFSLLLDCSRQACRVPFLTTRLMAWSFGSFLLSSSTNLIVFVGPRLVRSRFKSLGVTGTTFRRSNPFQFPAPTTTDKGALGMVLAGLRNQNTNWALVVGPSIASRAVIDTPTMAVLFSMGQDVSPRPCQHMPCHATPCHAMPGQQVG